MQPIRKTWSTTISLSTQIKQDDQTEAFDFKELGTLTLTPNAVYLRYTEHQYEVATPVTFKISQIDDILLHRHNYFTDVQLHFSPNQEFQSHYITSQGNIPITVRTNQLTNEITNDHPYGKLAVAYTLLNNHEPIGNYQLTLTIPQ
ncbi:DUF1934 domain-containing protein [Weissella paramesenteroides]|uniref:DUF1934 domain-containing protein n=1 Tax=Weissella paramesenteroides TaxID=1249 RepID=UPI00388EC98D